MEFNIDMRGRQIVIRAHRMGAIGLLTGLILFFFAGLCISAEREEETSTDVIGVYVSILPQAYFVERVGGRRVEVSVMVGPGQSPATYEPSPQQMAGLAGARLYFRIGVPFEHVWIDRIREANDAMSVVDTRKGISLRTMVTHRHDDQDAPIETRKAEESGHFERDPHIWLSLRLVKIQSRNIFDALVSVDVSHKTFYEENLRAFHKDLDALDQQIRRDLVDVKTRKFMVFHPSWGYFADDYGLIQIPIEMEGKEPSAKSLAHVLDEAEREGIRVIFVQKQFSSGIAETIARAIGGKIARVDPLARDYLKNMEKIATTFAKNLR